MTAVFRGQGGMDVPCFYLEISKFHGSQNSPLLPGKGGMRIKNRSIISFFRKIKPGNHFWPNRARESRVFIGFALLSYCSLESRLEENTGD